MSKNRRRIDSIDNALEIIKDIPIETIQYWTEICVISIQLAKNNRIEEWMECRKKLKEICNEYPELCKIRVFYAKRILRELKIRKIIGKENDSNN